jgi:cyclopropane fatty-acyl-phospholipid synthase-like methyltransferase
MPQPLKPHAPACDRNREPILAVLRRHFSDRRRVLEIGSGTGQHAVHFAAALPDLTWQTSDLDENLPGIRLWLEEVRLANLPAPLSLDVNGAWPQRGYDAVFSANTLHIMSWSDVRALFEHLQPVLESDACVAIYGPFNYAGRFTSPSNADFDAWLKQRSPLMGIRDFEAVDALAQSIGLRLIEDCAMPANNRTLVWRREAPVARPAG